MASVRRGVEGGGAVDPLAVPQQNRQKNRRPQQPALLVETPASPGLFCFTRLPPRPDYITIL
jgi:hypothetical protein